MESLIKLNSNDENLNSEPDINTKHKVKVNTDRVTLNKNESEKLNLWLTQINTETNGFLEVSKSDLVNFLIKAHSEVLSKKEIKELKVTKYDLVRHLNLITPLLKKAIEENDHEKIKLLQAELKNLEIKSNPETSLAKSPIKKSRKQRIKKNENQTIESKNEGMNLEK